MWILGLTGNIASGKSTVLRLFSKYFSVIDSDQIVKKLYENSKIQKQILQKFGFTSKPKLADLIFSNKTARKQLEQIVHPLVFKEIQKQLQTFRKQKKVFLVVVDVPLLFETKFEKKCTWTLVVASTRKLQIQRLQKQGYSKQEALQRMQAQKKQEWKLNQTDFVVWNTKSKKVLATEVNKWISFFIGLYYVC
ncbi:MAG: dephospho-CoA kinase [Candidatus Diapherotrites archaeon]|nr:dephospho-CoA kinase [Candidatus Diapherotrites archaeon]